MYRFAIIGCGDAGVRHAEILEDKGRVAVACDKDAARAGTLAQRHDAEAWYSVDDLLHSGAEFDIALVCTPNGLHAEHIIKMLQAGKHLVCEQPLCLTAAAAWQIVETEKFTRRKLFLFPQWEPEGIDALAAEVISACGAINSFSIKAVRSADADKEWKTKSFPGGGLLYSVFFDVMQLLYRLMGAAVTAVGAAQRGSDEQAEKSGNVSLGMKSGAQGGLYWSVSEEADPLVRIELSGENGSILITGRDHNWSLTKEDRLLLSVSNDGERYVKFYKGLIQSLKDGSSSNLFDGLPVVEFTERIYKGITFTTPASS